MRVLLFYRPESEQARPVLDYLRDFKRMSGRELPVMDVDSPQAGDLCRLYDVVEYPTIVALNNDGQLQQVWRGLPLPQISEVSYYLQQQ